MVFRKRATRDESIYAFLRAQIKERGAVDESSPLPDDKPSDSSTVRFAAGALDGIVSHHMARAEPGEDFERVARAVAAALEDDTGGHDAAIAGALGEMSATQVVDVLIDRLVTSAASGRAVNALGGRLGRNAQTRDVVKIGIALLGVSRIGPHLDVIRTLGLHSEFSLFAVVALSNGLEEPAEEIWALARAQRGWGRVHAVEHLEGTPNPEIRRWILREGFRNTIMDEYLAFIAVDTGGLFDALGEPNLDEELLRAASDLVSALIVGGPARDIESLTEPQALVSRYVGVMDRHAQTVFDHSALWMVAHKLRSILNPEEEARLRAEKNPALIKLVPPDVDQESSPQGSPHENWSRAHAARDLAMVEQVLARPLWVETAERAISSGDSQLTYLGIQVAARSGLDVFPKVKELIAADPVGGPWYQAWQLADEQKAGELVELARSSFDYDELGGGPTPAIGGFGSIHDAFGWTLQGLRRFPGVGHRELLVGCSSPLVRNRNVSASVIGEIIDPPSELVASLRAMAASDPAPSCVTNASAALEKLGQA